MDKKPKLSDNFNIKLFSEIKRSVQYKKLFDVAFTSFLKALGSVLSLIIKPLESYEKNNSKNESEKDKI
ncbi:MAG: hypothetical protein H6613_14465 [Ignavibacteriales bacterium]|nr:hypothetical protein [Ignavibacteriota bacterium]MCB0749443.1 hypothetical protein [Ignavibacteriota bacterium]MCB9249654.1 hypothetical protein [Ignavibacteriales bacterium]